MPFLIRKTSFFAIATFLCVIGFTSCASDQNDPESALLAFAGALAQGDCELAMTYVHPDVVERATNDLCSNEKRVQRMQSKLLNPYHTEVIKVEGTSAKIKLIITGEGKEKIQLEQHEGLWYVVDM